MKGKSLEPYFKSSSSLFQFIISFTEVYGKLIFCFPWEDSRNFLLYRILYYFLLLLATFFNMSVWIDSFTNMSWMTFMGSETLADAADLSLQYFGLIWCDFMVRFNSICFRGSTREMWHQLKSFPLKTSDCKHERILLLFVVAIPIWLVSATLGSLYNEMKFQPPADFKSTIYFDNRVALRVLYILGDFWAALSLLYAWLWFISAGAALVCRLEHFTEKSEAMIPGLGRTRWVTSRKTVPPLPLLTEFMMIKANFETYGKVAGGYALALVTYFSMEIIGLLSQLISERTDDAGGTNIQIVLTLVSFWALLLVISFGNRVSKAVQKHADQMQNLQLYEAFGDNEQISKILTLLSKWNWRLNAMDLFEVDRRLIPKVVATVFTYFIFIFQLKASEDKKGMTNVRST